MKNQSTRLAINIKSKEVLEVLEQLPKGCKGKMMFDFGKIN